MTPQHDYALRIAKPLWNDLTIIKELFHTTSKALITEACIDLVKKKQMELPQLRKARVSIHTAMANR